MGKTTGISWADATWNPWQGCTKVSEGCRNCYMYRQKERFGQDPFNVVRSKPATFYAPQKWAKSGKLPEGSRIFVCSWSDFFHEDADEWRTEAWNVIASLPQYDFLIPTKRIERVAECLPIYWGSGGWSNVWLGVSIENQKTADERIPILIETPAVIKWLSIEPMLEEIDLIKYFYLHVLWWAPWDWVVVGGESGPHYRSMDIEWVQYLLAQCHATATPFFVKQLGGWPDTRHELSDFPEDLRVREYPYVSIYGGLTSSPLAGRPSYKTTIYKF